MSLQHILPNLASPLQRACAELERRLRAGEDCDAAGLLAACPSLEADRDAALELLYTEFVLREELGQRPDPQRWLERFPQWEPDLRELFQVHRFVGTEAGSGLRLAETLPGLPSGFPERGSYGGTKVGRYELLEEVGRGGMGVVYKARQEGLNRVVALKMLLAEEYAAEAALARFRQEAVALAALQHPNIVQIHEVGEHDGRPFFSLEYINGGNLSDRLAGNPLPARQAAELLEVLARAVAHAHQAGVVHRDLKPANILLAREPAANAAGYDTPKVADFGLARLLVGGGVRTESGAILGTPRYMAPEQTDGRASEVGVPADIYALGAILYECLTGRPPFQAETPMDTMLQVRTLDPVPVRRLQPRVPLDLETICLKCLRKNPGMRYATALELAEDLHRFLAGEPIRARPPSALDRLGKFARRNRAAVAGVAAVFVALLLGLAGTGLELFREQRLLAESHAQAARLAVRRGAWRDVLESLDRALAAGHPNDAELRLQKVRAWCALHEVGRAAQELEALAGRPDLGEMEGQVLLWRADIALGRSADDENALALLESALKKGLPAPEEAYAHGLCAQTSLEAIQHFEEAVRLDPFHPRANALLAALLLATGRVPEARARLAVACLLFPEDPTFPLLQALVHAWEDRMELARAVLAEARPRLGERQAAAAAALLELARQVRRLEGPLADKPGSVPPSAVLELAPVVWRGQSAFRALQEHPDEPELLLPIPPVLTRVFRRAANVLPPALRGEDNAKAIGEVRELIQAYPEGLLQYVLGMLLFEEQRLAEAEEAFLEAARTPSFIPVRRAALFAAVFCEWELATKPGESAKLMKERALKNAHELLQQGRASPFQANYMAWLARQSGDLALGRQALADWERQAPRDLKLLQQRLELELHAGAFGKAIELADQILTRAPKDEAVRKQRAEAVQRLRQQADQYRP